MLGCLRGCAVSQCRPCISNQSKSTPGVPGRQCSISLSSAHSRRSRRCSRHVPAALPDDAPGTGAAGPAAVVPTLKVEEAEASASNASSSPVSPSGQLTWQEQYASWMQAMSKHRRVITVAVAVADVAFLWLAAKGVKTFFFHD